MTKANTLPKMPPAIAAMPRKIYDCDVVAAGWFDARCTVRVVVWRELVREVSRTDTPDSPGLWRYSVRILGRGVDNPLCREVTSEAEALACVEAIKQRPLTPQICHTLGFEP